MPITLPQDFQTVGAHLEALIAKVRSGASGEDVVRELEQAITLLGEQGIQDPLTGLLNQRGLMRRLDEELERSRRTGHAFSIALIAIDGYDDIVAQHGVELAQAAARAFATSAARLLRALDAMGRISDDEFALVLPTTWIEHTGIPVARIISGVSNAAWADKSPELLITFSSGLTPNAYGDTASSMIIRAREALALARAKGPGASAQLEKILPPIDVGGF